MLADLIFFSPERMQSIALGILRRQEKGETLDETDLRNLEIADPTGEIRRNFAARG